MRDTVTEWILGPGGMEHDRITGPWYDMPIPPEDHICWEQTHLCGVGIPAGIGGLWTQIEIHLSRCPCGAWQRALMDESSRDKWRDRNSRREK